MGMLHQPPVDQGGARGRRAVGLARTGMLLVLAASVAGATALLGWGLDRHMAPAVFLPSAFPPAALQAEPAVTPAQSTPNAPTAIQPTQQDESQPTYFTNSG